MGYYGASVYRGDYYGQRGDYYHNRRGDPGFFDFISDIGSGIVDIGKKILPVAAPILGGLVGGPVGMGIGAAAGGLLGRVLSPGPPIPSPPLSFPPVWAAASPGTGSTVAMIPTSPFSGFNPSGSPARLTPMPGGSTAVQPAGFNLSVGGAKGVRLIGGGRGTRVAGAHHRRMNTLNPRALSRALRRARGFQKYATKVLKLVGEKRHVEGFKHKKKR